MYLGLHNSNTVVFGFETVLESEEGNKSLQSGVTLPIPPASKSWTERKWLLQELERREVTGSNPANHHGNRIKEGRVVKEKLCWEEGCAVLHCWRKVRRERHPCEDALLSHPAFPGGNDLLGVGEWKKKKKKASKPPSQRWEEEGEEE